MRKAWKCWVQMTRILVRKGEEPRMSGMFFKSVVQAVLIFGSETWVLTPRMERALGHFQQRVAQRITGRHTRRRGGRAESTHPWRQLWSRRYLKISGSTSKRGKIRLRNILQRDQFWTFVIDWFGVRETGFLGGGGNRRDST